MATPGRRRHRRLAIAAGTPRAGLHLGIPVEQHERLSAIADACGASLGVIVTELVAHVEIDPVTGRPLWWDDAEQHWNGSSDQTQEPLVS